MRTYLQRRRQQRERRAQLERQVSLWISCAEASHASRWQR